MGAERVEKLTTARRCHTHIRQKGADKQDLHSVVRRVPKGVGVVAAHARKCQGARYAPQISLSEDDHRFTIWGFVVSFVFLSLDVMLGLGPSSTRNT